MLRFRGRALVWLAVSIGLWSAACSPAGAGSPGESIGATAQPLTTPVPTIAGIAGSYVQEGFADPMTEMTLGSLSQANGSYSRTLCGSVCSVEQGCYGAMANNPAIGFASILFEPTSGATAVYQIQGVDEDATGAIDTLQLQRLLPDGGAPASFLMERVGSALGQDGGLDASLPGF